MSGELGGSDPTQIQRKIQRDVAVRGWSWIWVFDPTAKRPPFAYTIGLGSSLGRPEVVVAGLSKEVSGSVLSSVQAMLAEGATYGDGDASTDILEEFSVRFRTISQDLVIANLVQASVFYGERSFTALQLIWPDRNGNFSDEEHAPVWLSDRQALPL